MLPRRGEVWTYRKRHLLLSVIGGATLLALLACGLYFWVTEGDWLLVAVAAFGLVGQGLFFWDGRRHFRDEP